MGGQHYYSPPPPSPYPPPPPPPPTCNNTIPTPPSCCVCKCICPPLPPPPPVATPPWSPTPNSPSPGGKDHTVYIAVFVSLGGVFFLAFLAAGLFYILKKRKPPVPPVCVEEHRHVYRDAITTGPCGEQTVTTITLDDDVRVCEAAEVGVAAAAIGASHAKPSDNDYTQAASHAEGHYHLKTG